MSVIDYLNPYAYAMRVRRILYERGIFKSHHPGIPVISIGNLTLGGTGKSPLVVKIADYLHNKHGKRVAVVSRGYRRHSKGYMLVRDGDEILVKVEDSGDEAQMLAELLPYAIVIVDEDRVHGARQAKDLGAEVILLDDSYQHLRIERDLNILLVGMHGLGNVVPFGNSREPQSAARAADVVLLTGSAVHEENNYWKEINRYLKVDAVRGSLRAIPGMLEGVGSANPFTLNDLRGKRVLAVSSIASPHRFQEMLATLGTEVVARDLGDHGEYNEVIVADILGEALKANVDLIVTTAKDIVKSRGFFEHIVSSKPVYILQQDLEFLRDERSFYKAIDHVL
jgi:tetraacyldisaccharide 4'-kinase